MTYDETYAPWISDPDDPSDALMSPEDIQRAAKLAASLNADLVDHSMDGPIFKPQSPAVYAKRRKSRRELSAHNAAIAGFTEAINEAEKHRRVLKRRFGYSDRQIGTMAMIYNSRKRTP